MTDLPTSLSLVSQPPCILTFDELKFEMSSTLKSYHALPHISATFLMKTELFQGTLILVQEIDNAYRSIFVFKVANNQNSSWSQFRSALKSQFPFLEEGKLLDQLIL